MKTRVSFTFTAETVAKLKALSEKTGIPQTRIMERELKRLFTQLEEKTAFDKERRRQVSGTPLYEWECEE